MIARGLENKERGSIMVGPMTAVDRELQEPLASKGFKVSPAYRMMERVSARVFLVPRIAAMLAAREDRDDE